MTFSSNSVGRLHFIEKFIQVATAPDPDLATAALLIARLEYPRLDASPYVDTLDMMGATARNRVGAITDPLESIGVLNDYLFEEQGFAGNEQQYDDPRNSFLNDVLERRTGIPITLSVVYMEVARRAGVSLEGVNFPGHFLLRVRGWSGQTQMLDHDLIVDPFHGGAVLSENDCQRLLRQHGSPTAAFDPGLLVGATKPQILVRMLVNLKRIYVQMRSFPQARAVSEMLVALNPSALAELRDRGLLAYHLNDFSAALRDLEEYLRFSNPTGPDDENNDEYRELWEHVKTLRRRVAGLN